ncbi:ABC transporter substrate-binding protein [uncultured Salinicola sp.]|uniref:ABC transporter substrate-binding protein n=1 Tax=uncultured Salinicola sp. TaxID=1193542 RepID=UPI002603433E|nr:ABC transporter substrate-binding protein [uncultured Salinicola sp.]
MPRLKRFTRLLSSLVAISALAGGMVTVAQASKTLVVGDQAYNNLSVMEAAGMLDDLPYEVQWKQFSSGSPVAEALNTGNIDIGFVGDAPPLFLGALGGDFNIIGVSRQNLDGVAIVVRGDSTIHSLADLRGKRIAIWRGSWSQQLLFNALAKAGIPRDAVELRYLDALDASHALDSGAVDAIGSWDPYVIQLERRGARVLTTAEGLIPAQSFIIASDSAIGDKRAIIGDFLQRVQRARAWSLDDPGHTDVYAEAWAGKTRADPDIAKAWFARSRTRVEPITPAAIDGAQQTVDFFAGIGLIDTYDVSRLFDDAFTRALRDNTHTDTASTADTTR